MKYKALKTVTRYNHDKGTVVIAKGQTYTAEQVANMPKWYITDNYLAQI